MPEELSKGDIFLNISITEAFCLSVLEASSCGLYVLTTDVGGIKEILPKNIMRLCKPNSKELISNLIDILDNKLYLKHDK